MSIVSSTFEVGTEQLDGRSQVTERHTDHVGVVHMFSYLSDPADDRAGTMSARVASIVEGLKNREIETIVGDLQPPVYVHATKATVLARWREDFRDAKRERACRLSKWLLDHLEAGAWSDANMAVLFGVSGAQWLVIKGRIDGKRQLVNSMDSEGGE